MIEASNPEDLSQIPVLMEIVQLGETKVAKEAITKLVIERERHYALLTKIEQHDFPEIILRCQLDMQNYLENALASISKNVGEHLTSMLRAEMKVTISHLTSTTHISNYRKLKNTP